MAVEDDPVCTNGEGWRSLGPNDTDALFLYRESPLLSFVMSFPIWLLVVVAD